MENILYICSNYFGLIFIISILIVLFVFTIVKRPKTKQCPQCGIDNMLMDEYYICSTCGACYY